ncbi:unnamed protein product, partial [Owenia fusiformis]
DGYVKSGGDDTLTCIPQGNSPPIWNGTPLQCEQPTCPPPTIRGTVDITSTDTEPYFLGETITWDCGGDKCSLPRTIVCSMINGVMRFNSTRVDCVGAACAESTCDLPPSISNGNFVTTPPIAPGAISVVLNTRVVYSCDNCFTTNDPVTYVCREDSTQQIAEAIYVPSGDPPTCRRVTCPGTPQSPLGGTVSTTENTCGTLVQYSCNDPCRELVGSSIRECQSDGTWSAAEPTCERKTCSPQADNPLNGNVSPQDSFCGARLTYRCDPCFRLQGSPLRQCTPSGWSGAAPTCIPLSCDPISAPNNGQRFPPQGNQDCTDEISFQCNSGYRLDGAQTITCVSSNIPGSRPSWNSPPPRCIPTDCEPMPKDPEFGSAAPKGTSIGTRVFYRCDPCYTLTSSQGPINVRECKGGGVGWDPLEEPTCRPLECPFVTIPNGQSTPSDRDCGTIRRVTCDDNYVLDGPDTFECRQQNGQVGWTEIPKCQVVCTRLMVTDPNVEIVSDSADPVTDTYKPNQRVVYRCRGCNRLRPVGPFGQRIPERVCKTNGQWDIPIPPSCEPLICPGNPRPPTGGRVDTTSNDCGTTATYSCNDPCDELSGPEQRTCLPSGQWSAPEPTCIKKRCFPRPFGQFPVQVTPNDNTCGITVTYSCPRCYSLTPESSRTRSCGSNGQWTPSSVPSCSRITCPALTLENGFVSGMPDCDMTLVFQCNFPYQLEGSRTTKCTEDGTYTNDKPICILDI